MIKPNGSLKNEYLDMIEDWNRSEEKIIPWSLNLYTINLPLMIEKSHRHRKEIVLEDSFVEFTNYWMINKRNKILGAVDIRNELNESLSYRCGNIGYGVRSSEEEKDMLIKMLFLALEICKAKRILRVLITCSKNNIGSARTII